MVDMEIMTLSENKLKPLVLLPWVSGMNRLKNYRYTAILLIDGGHFSDRLGSVSAALPSISLCSY